MCAPYCFASSSRSHNGARASGYGSGLSGAPRAASVPQPRQLPGAAGCGRRGAELGAAGQRRRGEAGGARGACALPERGPYPACRAARMCGAGLGAANPIVERPRRRR